MIPNPQPGEIWRAANGMEREVIDVWSELFSRSGEVLLVHYRSSVFMPRHNGRDGICTLATWKTWVSRYKAEKVT